jgi:hypothetical protein
MMLQIWSALLGHCKGTDTPGDTLQRLARKHAEQFFPDLTLPELRETDMSVSLSWMQEDWLASISRTHARTQPGGTNFRPELPDLPVIVLDWEGHKILIDGATRINRWLGGKEGSRRPVYILPPASGV